MVTVMRRMAARATPVAATERLALWLLLLLDGGVAAWMVAMGRQLDGVSGFLSVITLGGRHGLVLGLAIGGLAVLVIAAVLTGGFHRADGIGRGLAAVGGASSLVAAGGLLSVLLVVALAVGAAALVGRAFGP